MTEEVIDCAITSESGAAPAPESVTTPAAVGRGSASAFSIVRREGPWRDALLRRMLAVADLLAGLAGSASIVAIGNAKVGVALWSALLAPVWIVVAKLLGLYERDQQALRHLTVDELPRILTWVLAGTATVSSLLALTPAGWLGTAEAIRVGFVAAVAVILFRALARTVWRLAVPPERVLIVGEGRLADAMRRKLELFPDVHAEIAAERPALAAEELSEGSPTLRDLDRIVIAMPALDEELIPDLISFCRRYQIKLTVVPPASRLFGTAVELQHIADLPVLEYNTWDVSRSTQLLKRALDLAVSALVLVLLAPLLLLIGALVFLGSGWPILFAQARAGQGARPFTILKFRTMVPGAEEMLEDLIPIKQLNEPMFKLRRDPRVTRLGALLRRTSLDELPQFLNVLRGDMSLVGPRPEQLEFVALYESEHLFRLAVKPGLTGPMQVYGRGELNFEERLAVEREYVEHLSIARDLHILGLTVASIFNGRGAY